MSAESFMEDWNARHLERYTNQVKVGQHDAACEQRERSSLCHCSKRRREAMGRTTLPTIAFPSPCCSVCETDVEFDGDGFDCPTCSASWDRNASDGSQADTWTDDYGEDIGGERWGRRLLDLIEERP